MLQNKIFQYFGKEIIKTFLVILIGLTAITWTVKAVNFLELIIDSGYSIFTYFSYTFLNMFGIITKFIPLAFLIALIMFIVKQAQENEFIILWTAGVKKRDLVNYLFLVSIVILVFNLLFSVFFSPLALNKSRQLLKDDSFNSLIPTVRVQEFSDSFKGLTLMVEKKFNNEIKNIFIHDSANALNNLTTNYSKEKETTIFASKGIIKEQNLILFNGQIITTSETGKNDFIKFDQLNISIDKFKNSTIKTPKLQETSTFKLLKCVLINSFNGKICNQKLKKEIIPILNRRIVFPLYLPLITLICCLLLIKNNKNFYLNKYSVFTYSFLILLYAELTIRYTGLSQNLVIFFIFTPLVLSPLIYLYLTRNFLIESKT